MFEKSVINEKDWSKNYRAVHNKCMDITSLLVGRFEGNLKFVDMQ